MSTCAFVPLAAAGCEACALLQRTVGIQGSGMVAISVCSATVARQLCRRVPSTRPALERLAAPSLYLMCIFLSSIGATAKLSQVVAAGPAAAVFGAIVLLVHCAVMLGGVRLLNATNRGHISLPSLLIASNANIGGAGTAMAMASAMGWTHLLPAAATCGAIGYGGATLLGLALFRVLA